MDDQQITPDMEEPLDPAFEKVRRKMVRLLAVSIGTMMIGVLAVLAAVVWRINETTTTRAYSIDLPAGAVVQHMVMDDQSLGFMVVLPDGSSELIVYDRADGTVVSRSAITQDLPAPGQIPE